MQEKNNKEMLVDVKVGYSRKLNMHEHGGLQYETTDITQELTAKNVLLTRAEGISANLYKRCVKKVEKRIAKIDAETDTPPKSKTGIELDKEEMDEIVEIFNSITMAKSMKALRRCAKEVKTIAPSLKKAQIKFLRAHYKERLRSLKT